MDLETIALIAMGGCLFLWLVVNFIITLHNVRIAKAAGLTVQVQCEKEQSKKATMRKMRNDI